MQITKISSRVKASGAKHSERIASSVNSPEIRRKLSKNRTVTKHKYVLVQAVVVVAVVGLVAISRFYDNKSEAVVTRTNDLDPLFTLDEVSQATVASSIATDGDLLISNNVRNLRDSLNAKVDFASTDSTTVSKPQIIKTDAKSVKDIFVYTAKSGDSISSIAKKFNITSNTIRWENNIVGDIVSPGRKLTILPISGLKYVFKSGDSVESLARKYNASAELIEAFNDAELSGFKVGQTIIIPEGKKPEAKPVYIAVGPQAAASSTGFSFGGADPIYNGNGYSYGYCTWHAANRRAQIGRPIPSNLGNAVTWATLAAQAGLSVSGTPQAGAVLWHKDTYLAGGLGHVAFVEKVNANGSILVSDMNYPYWGVVTTRTIKPSEFGGYLFIY